MVKICRNCAALNAWGYARERCELHNIRIENLSSVCDDWEPNNEAELVMLREENKYFKGCIKQINELKHIQEQSLCNSYMYGLYNGIEVLLAILENREPVCKIMDGDNND